MDKKLRETTNLGVEIMNSKRQVKRMVGHVVQIRVCRLTSTWCLTSLFRVTFTANAKREFVPRDQIVPFLVQPSNFVSWNDHRVKIKFIHSIIQRERRYCSTKWRNFTQMFLWWGVSLSPPLPPHYTNVCVKFRHFVRAVPSLVSIKLKLIILRGFFSAGVLDFR